MQNGLVAVGNDPDFIIRKLRWRDKQFPNNLETIHLNPKLHLGLYYGSKLRCVSVLKPLVLSLRSARQQPDRAMGTVWESTLLVKMGMVYFLRFKMHRVSVWSTPPLPTPTLNPNA